MGSLDPGAGARVGANSLAVAGRSIRIAAKGRFESPQETEEAVRALMETPGVLEAWATNCLNNDDNPEPGMGHIWHRFRFSDLPAPSRQGAMETLAVAYLAAGQPVPEQLREEVHVEFGA